ncbi:MAG: twin-arginine translocase TatA/TatE family subunit [Planctomycetota bacterium]|jgi:TatA/E family protein of Tat protein translocase|nr:twin-arginine translocase TatA/TatE family subunit [Planctomycetota bacterium]MDP6762983.1 twin-arginine translocase TatA/TatE family subunit [Planctomycetota bacterium]MDP6987851.1 twin-arginine translocase TatA/TatE family subunit [Planctomycetota bacterium]
MLQTAIIGWQELWPIALVLVFLFGAAKLPALARAMGSSVNEFKKGLGGGEKGELPEESESADEAKESEEG